MIVVILLCVYICCGIIVDIYVVYFAASARVIFMVRESCEKDLPDEVNSLGVRCWQRKLHLEITQGQVLQLYRLVMQYRKHRLNVYYISSNFV